MENTDNENELKMLHSVALSLATSPMARLLLHSPAQWAAVLCCAAYMVTDGCDGAAVDAEAIGSDAEVIAKLRHSELTERLMKFTKGNQRLNGN